MYILAMGVGCGLAGIAGGLIAPVLSLSPHMGHSMLLMILMVVVLGGLESVPGAVLAGLLLGLALSFGYFFLGALSQVLAFLVIAVVMIIKPGGLLGNVIEE
jgi:branched-chain amino acid transport system permease protein